MHQKNGLIMALLGLIALCWTGDSAQAASIRRNVDRVPYKVLPISALHLKSYGVNSLVGEIFVATLVAVKLNTSQNVLMLQSDSSVLSSARPLVLPLAANSGPGASPSVNYPQAYHRYFSARKGSHSSGLRQRGVYPLFANRIGFFAAQNRPLVRDHVYSDPGINQQDDAGFQIYGGVVLKEFREDAPVCFSWGNCWGTDGEYRRAY